MDGNYGDPTTTSTRDIPMRCAVQRRLQQTARGPSTPTLPCHAVRHLDIYMTPSSWGNSSSTPVSSTTFAARSTEIYMTILSRPSSSGKRRFQSSWCCFVFFSRLLTLNILAIWMYSFCTRPGAGAGFLGFLVAAVVSSSHLLKLLLARLPLDVSPGEVSTHGRHICNRLVTLFASSRMESPCVTLDLTSFLALPASQGKQPGVSCINTCPNQVPLRRPHPVIVRPFLPPSLSPPPPNPTTSPISNFSSTPLGRTGPPVRIGPATQPEQQQRLMAKANGMIPVAVLALLVLLLMVPSPAPRPCSAAVDREDAGWVGKKGAEAPPHRPESTSPFQGGKASSAMFALVGNVYPDGVYYVEMAVGNPPKPYYLDIDTGSDLTWLHCDAPCVSCPKCPHPWYRPKRNQLVPCEDPLCAALQDASPVSSSLVTTASSILAADEGRCARPSDQCDYEVEYADSGSSLGVLVTDAFALRLTNGSYAYPSLVFGCGYDQHASPNQASPTDGVLGLGPGKLGVLGQLRRLGLVRSVVGQCLGRRGGGFLFLGDTLVPRSGMTWTPMSIRGGFRKYYAPGPASLLLGKQPLVLRDFQVVFDSGSSYTYFASHPYELFLTTLMKDLTGMPLKAAPEDPTLPLCWKGNKPFRSVLEVRKYFSSLVLAFPAGRKVAAMEIPPEGYLITTKYGNACLGLLNGTEAGLQDLNLIGDISMQDQLFVYDNEQERIGWGRANCDRNVKW